MKRYAIISKRAPGFPKPLIILQPYFLLHSPYQYILYLFYLEHLEYRVRNWKSSHARITSPTDRLLRALYKEHIHGDGELKAMIDKLNHQERILNTQGVSFSYTPSSSWHRDERSYK